MTNFEKQIEQFVTTVYADEPHGALEEEDEARLMWTRLNRLYELDLWPSWWSVGRLADILELSNKLLGRCERNEKEVMKPADWQQEQAWKDEEVSAMLEMLANLERQISRSTETVNKGICLDCIKADPSKKAAVKCRIKH
jgi:hypothetical protein